MSGGGSENILIFFLQQVRVEFRAQGIDAFQAFGQLGALQGQAGNQCLDLGQRWHQAVEGRDRFHRGADDQVGQLAQRRSVDVAEQHDAGVALLGRAGHTQGLGLVATVIEDQHHILALHVEQPVRQLGVVFQGETAGAQQPQMVEQVVGQEAAEAPTEAMHVMAAVEQPLHENAHVFGLSQGLGVDEVALTGGQVLAPGIALLQFGPRFQQGAGERRRWSMSLSRASWNSA
nr:hypothetical protein GCM10020185_03340 [Pseudomonas brassicacearum subsp. brassicacearum]